MCVKELRVLDGCLTAKRNVYIALILLYIKGQLRRKSLKIGLHSLTEGLHRTIAEDLGQVVCPFLMSSIPPIYSVLTAEDIGIKQCSLERVGLSKGGVVLNKKACIMSGELIRSKATKKR